MGYRGYGLPTAEVISEANVGLMQAVKRFDPEKGFRLATYAMWWIRASIQEYILRSWSLVKMGTTAAQKKLFFNLRKAKNKIGALEEGELRPENVAQIAHDLSVTEAEVISMNRRMAGGDASLNAQVSGDGDGTAEWQDWLEDEDADQATAYAERDELESRRELLLAVDGRAERARAAHPDRAAPEGRAGDARGAVQGLRRQPRADPADRGPRLREAAEEDARTRGRARHGPGGQLISGDGGTGDIQARRSAAAQKAAATRQRNALERRRLEAEKRSSASREARETIRRELAAGTLDPSSDVEHAVVRAARAAQARARRGGLDWERELPRLMLEVCRLQGARCALSGVSFSMEALGHGAAPRPFAPSIDRIDSRLGYTLENCRLIAWALNVFFGVWGSDVALRLARGLDTALLANELEKRGSDEDLATEGDPF